MKFWPSRGTIGSPVLPSGEQSLFRAYHSAGSISRFSHSFLLSALIPLKVPSWLPSSGCAEVCPSRPHRLTVSLFPFFSYLGGILFCQLERSPVAILFFVFLCSSSPRLFLLVPWEVAGSFGACVFLLCFLFSFPVLFFRAVLIFFWLCTWKDPRLLMVAEDPGYLTFCCGFLFLLDVSSFGLQASWVFLFFRGPLVPASLDLACFFLLGLAHSFGPPSLWSFLDLNKEFHFSC